MEFEKDDVDGGCSGQNMVNRNIIKFKLVTKEARLPTRGSDGAVGFDLYASEDVWLLWGKFTSVETGIEVTLPEGTYGRISSRSGLAFIHNVFAFDGVIDPDYTGSIRVLMVSWSHFPYKVLKGHRIAQLICEKVSVPQAVQIEEETEEEKAEEEEAEEEEARMDENPLDLSINFQWGLEKKGEEEEASPFKRHMKGEEEKESPFKRLKKGFGSTGK